MRHVFHAQGLDGELGSNLLPYLIQLTGITSIIATPQVLDKRDCIVDGDIDIEYVLSQLQSLGYNNVNVSQEGLKKC